jgi:hypothetical protein
MVHLTFSWTLFPYLFFYFLKLNVLNCFLGLFLPATEGASLSLESIQSTSNIGSGSIYFVFNALELIVFG